MGIAHRSSEPGTVVRINLDTIPGISQVKSVAQLARGDVEGAIQTQENFVNDPIVQSVGRGIKRDLGEKLVFAGNIVSDVVDNTPVLGHVKGFVHYACGDREGGDGAMIAATRTTAVMTGGMGGFVVGGPAGAAGGAIFGGYVTDSVLTATQKFVYNNEERRYGYHRILERVVNGNMNRQEVLEAAMLPVFDGLTGYIAGDMYNKFLARRNPAVKFGEAKFCDIAMDVIEDSSMNSSSDENHFVSSQNPPGLQGQVLRLISWPVLLEYPPETGQRLTIF